MKHILSVLVENRPGALARIVGLISGRGYNIHSLNVAPTQDLTTSRLTMVVPGDAKVLEQVTKQLNKVVEVIKVYDFEDEKHVEREMLLVKARFSARNRPLLIETVSLFRAEVVGVQSRSLTIQMTGTSEEVDSFLELMKPHGIQDVARTGVAAVGCAD